MYRKGRRCGIRPQLTYHWPRSSRIMKFPVLLVFLLMSIGAASLELVPGPEPKIIIIGHDQEAALINLDKGLAIFNISYDGSSSEFFRALLLSPNGDELQLMINIDRPFNGSTVVWIEDSGIYGLDVGFGGNWTVEVSQPLA